MGSFCVLKGHESVTFGFTSALVHDDKELFYLTVLGEIRLQSLQPSVLAEVTIFFFDRWIFVHKLLLSSIYEYNNVLLI